MTEKKTRSLEVAIALADYTWYDGVYIEIPADTPKNQIETVAREVTLAHPALMGENVSHVWVYNLLEATEGE